MSFSTGIKHHAVALACIIGLSIIGIWPLFHSGLYSAHDIWHQVARLYHYSQATLDGQFPPSWISNMAHGYGYPLFFFSYHFPWMVGMPFIIAGMDVIPTLKLLFALPFTLSGIFMYVLAYTLTKNRFASTVGALLYLFAPYHFLSIYVSASIGSVFLFALLPLLLYGIVLILQKKVIPGVVLTALSSAALVLTHLMSIAIFFPFLALLVIACIAFTPQKKLFKPILMIGVSAVLALLLTAFYLVPLLEYLPITQAVEKGNGLVGLHERNLVRFSQLVYSPWGFGPIQDTALAGEISFQVGIAHWLTIGLGAGMLLYYFIIPKIPLNKKSAASKFLTTLLQRPNKQELLLILGVALSLGLTLFAMTTQAVSYWDFFAEKIVAIDYPFRLLLLAVFSASLLGSLLITFIKNKKVAWTAGVFLIVVALYTNRNHIRVNMYTDFDLDLYVRSELTTNTFNEYAPKGTETIISKEPKSLLEENIPYTLKARTTDTTEFAVTTEKSESLTANVFDFPGQTVFINDQFAEHDAAGGRVRLTVPEGNSTVKIVYQRTPLMLTTLIISTLTLLGLIVTYIYYLKQTRSKTS